MCARTTAFVVTNRERERECKFYFCVLGHKRLSSSPSSSRTDCKSFPYSLQSLFRSFSTLFGIYTLGERRAIMFTFSVTRIYTLPCETERETNNGFNFHDDSDASEQAGKQ